MAGERIDDVSPVGAAIRRPPESMAPRRDAIHGVRFPDGYRLNAAAGNSIPHFGDFAKSLICQNQFAGGKPAIRWIAAFHSPFPIKKTVFSYYEQRSKSL